MLYEDDCDTLHSWNTRNNPQETIKKEIEVQEIWGKIDTARPQHF